MLSKYWTITSKPHIQADSNIFKLEGEEVLLDGCVIKNSHLTINPNQKPLLSTSIKPGEHLQEDAVGVCIASDREDIAVGDTVFHRKGMRQLSKIVPEDIIQNVPWQDIDPSLYLSVLGTPGKTAWVSMTEIMKLQPGMTVGISGCSGTVGVLLAQMALKKGCNVIGYTSTQENADWLETLGVQPIVSSDTTLERLDKATKQLAPDGFDAYHENVDNVHLLTAIQNMKLNSTIALCGLMKSYTQNMGPGPNLLGTIYKNVNIQGFGIDNYKKSILANFYDYMEDIYADFEFNQHVVQGIHEVPALYSDLYNAYGKGKLIIKI